MAEKKWFRAKRYGWGWVPVTRQAWAAVLLYMTAIISGGLFLLRELNPSNMQLALFFIWTFAWTLPLMYLGFTKGEKPGWRWGGKDESDR